MPKQSPKPCGQPGCAALVGRGTGYCEAHQRPAWDRRAKPVKRFAGRRLQAARAQLFRSHPLCVLCQVSGRVSIATIRDHVIPLAEGGRDDEGNTQGLCDACHDLKSQAEAARGRGASKV